MTDYYEALDKQLFQLRSEYQKWKSNGNWITAAQVLYTRNWANGEAKLDDMSPFKILKNNASSLCSATAQAKEYCEKWEWKVEAAVTLSRSDNLAKISRML